MVTTRVINLKLKIKVHEMLIFLALQFKVVVSLMMWRSATIILGVFQLFNFMEFQFVRNFLQAAVSHLMLHFMKLVKVSSQVPILVYGQKRLGL